MMERALSRIDGAVALTIGSGPVYWEYGCREKSVYEERGLIFFKTN